MAATARDDGDTVEVRVLSKVYGGARAGDVIKVSKEEYERGRGRESALSGKVMGAALSLLSDEGKAKREAEVAQKAKQDLHLARRQQFADQAQAARDAQAIRAEQEAEASAKRAKELKAKAAGK